MSSIGPLPRFSATAGILVATAIASALPVKSQTLDASELIAIAKTAYPGELCWWERVDEDADQVRAHVIGFRYDYDEADAPERKATIYEMPCVYGAYNLGTIWFSDTEYEGLAPLHFAQPKVDVDYADSENTTIESMRIVGFESAPALINSHFDEETKTITHFSKWRGLGDAASSGTWEFRNGEYVLTRFEVDATFNGEIDPVVVYDATDQ